MYTLNSCCGYSIAINYYLFISIDREKLIPLYNVIIDLLKIHNDYYIIYKYKMRELNYHLTLNLYLDLI